MLHLKTSTYIKNTIFKKFFQSKKCKNSSEKCEEDFIISPISRPPGRNLALAIKVKRNVVDVFLEDRATEV